MLQYVHSQGIIHCDIKPSNIMLGRGDDKSHIFLSDFGLSLLFDPTNPPSERMTRQRGSEYYMSLNNHLNGGENHPIFINAATNICYPVALSPHDDMESLAYTILELQIGCLPWEDCMSHVDVFVTKQRWTGEHWAATTGCRKAFGDFLDAVRDRGQVLDYARWKQDLCGNSTPTPPGAEAPYKYDPLDDDVPIRRSGSGYNDSAREFHMPLTTAELARVPNSPESWPSLSGSSSSDGFHPLSTWSGPVTLEEAASFGDEREFVLRELALIDRPPTCGTSLRASDPREVMRPFGDILGEDVISKAGEDMDGDSGEMEDGSKQDDSGYNGGEGKGFQQGGPGPRDYGRRA